MKESEEQKKDGEIVELTKEQLDNITGGDPNLIYIEKNDDKII